MGSILAAHSFFMDGSTDEPPPIVMLIFQILKLRYRIKDNFLRTHKPKSVPDQ